MRSATQLIMTLVTLLVLSACTAAGNGDAGGTRLANGLHEQADGTVVALGLLEWVDLEGGFYALTGAPGDDDATIAVIANPDDFATQLAALVGEDVEVHGVLVEGATIRMAGPEVQIDAIREITGTPGPAE